MSMPQTDKPICLVAIDMGYGHLRPAHALSEYLSLPILNADQEPLARGDERRQWEKIRHAYERISRASQRRFWGWPLRMLLDATTSIPEFYPERDLSMPTRCTRYLEKQICRGLGHDLTSYLKTNEARLVTTYYAPAIAADRHGHQDIYCIVTDSDINRVWAPYHNRDSHITYLVPSQRARRRLRSYGVKQDRIIVTGFPLPDSLVGGPSLGTLKQTLRQRLRRLDTHGVFNQGTRHELVQLLGGTLQSDLQPPPAPHLAYAIGGAGAQSDLVDQFLPSLAPLLRAQKLRLTLVAGRRTDVYAQLQDTVRRHQLEELLGHGLAVLYQPDMDAYFRAFNTLLSEIDMLWTKPSELTFFGALGLPLILAPPVGVHEHFNRRWAEQSGAGLRQHDPRFAADWIKDWLKDGTLAAAAWSGFVRMPKFGLYKIAETIAKGSAEAKR